MSRSPLLRSLLTPLLGGLAACQEPFAEDRHDLASFRIVGVASEVGPGGLGVLPFAWSGHGAWYDARNVYCLGPDGGTAPRCAESPAELLAELPTEPTWPLDLDLEVSSAEALVERADVHLDGAPDPPVVQEILREGVPLDAEDALLPLEERAALGTTGALAGIPAAGGLRLTATIEAGAGAEVPVVRWMGTGGFFAELDDHTTDWFAAELVVDDDEIETATPLDAGIYPLVALVLDGKGGNTWGFVDVAVDWSGPLLAVEGRLLPFAEGAPAPQEPAHEGWWSLSLAVADSATGLVVTEALPLDEDPYAAGTAEPGPCDDADRPGHALDALAIGVCTRADIVSAPLFVQGRYQEGA